jgi:hypothetical protein
MVHCQTESSDVSRGHFFLTFSHVAVHIFFKPPASQQEVDVNYDLNRDRKVKVPNLITNTDNKEIDSMIQPPAANTINMYRAGVDFTDLNVLGIGRANPSNSWFAKNTRTNEARALFTIGHEMGHAIGRDGHTSSDPLALEYQRDLMYFGYVEGATFNQCRVRQVDWNLVNRDQ